MLETVSSINKIGYLKESSIPIYEIKKQLTNICNSITYDGEINSLGLKPIEYSNQRILTTQQLADNYGTESKIISNNFNRNKDHYVIGKHYHVLDGEEKRAFINLHQFEDGSKNAKFLYLWTEKGALLHAKSLNTDKAWEVYDMLVDMYFRAKEQTTNTPQPAAPESALSDRINWLIYLLEKQVKSPGAENVPLLPEPEIMLKPEKLQKYDMDVLKKKKLLTKDEAAFYIDMGKTTFTDIIKSNDFYLLIRIGHNRGKVRINREKLDQWINEQDGSLKKIR